MNTHVDFNTAKLLKEKGFDEPCFAYFNGTVPTRLADKGTLPISKLTMYRNTFLSYADGESVIPNEETFKQDLMDNPSKYSRHKWGIKVVAPTIAQVIMWLYEKHGIWISVFSTDDVTMFSYKISYEQGHYYSPNFDSSTEAYQEAINYTLKNLI